MRTQRECTNTARRGVFSGRLWLTSLLLGVLAIAGYAAYAATTDVKAKQVKKPRAVTVIEGDAVSVPAAAPAPATTTTGSGNAGTVTLDSVSQPAPVRSLVAPVNDECGGALTIPDGPYPLVTAPVDVTEATPQGADSGEPPV